MALIKKGGPGFIVDDLVAPPGLAGLPASAEASLEEARHFLAAATALLQLHAGNRKKDHSKARLRAAADLGWLAALRLCGVVLLRHGRVPGGHVKDVGDAFIQARTSEEKAVAQSAKDALNALHVQAFYYGDGERRGVERRLDALKRVAERLA